MNTTDKLQSIFDEEERLEAQGMRYLMIPERENLWAAIKRMAGLVWAAIKRRAGLVWGCLTLRPHPDFQDEFQTFRKILRGWIRESDGSYSFVIVEKDGPQDPDGQPVERFAERQEVP